MNEAGNDSEGRVILNLSYEVLPAWVSSDLMLRTPQLVHLNK